MRREARKYLFDVRQATDELLGFTAGKTRKHYLADMLLQAAVERKFEIIGEAVGQLAKLNAALAAQIRSRPDGAFQCRFFLHGWRHLSAASRQRAMALAPGARPDAFLDTRVGVNHPAGVWFPQPCHEMSIVSENYDFTLSLIQLRPSSGYYGLDENDDVESETLGDRIRRIHGV